MNKKGQFPVFYLFMIGVIIFLLTFGIASSLVKNSDQVSTDMDCSNVSISTTEKISCTVVDTVVPFFLAIIIGLGGMVMVAKVAGG
jgi:hypothetical protein